jgi:hypothetical protein
LRKYRTINRSKEQNEYLSDIPDGNIYKNFMNSKSNRNNNYTFICNTDGISKCSKSQLTIWLIYLAINEIPEGERFCLENVVIGRLSVGNSKPNFDVFLRPIIEELKILERGIDIAADSGKFDIVYFHVLYAVMGKPARADLLNLKSSNGEFGCIKCLQPGKNAITQKSNIYIYLTTILLNFLKLFIIEGNIRIYPFQKDNPDGPLRTKENYEKEPLESSRVSLLHNLLLILCFP